MSCAGLDWLTWFWVLGLLWCSALVFGFWNCGGGSCGSGGGDLVCWRI